MSFRTITRTEVLSQLTGMRFSGDAKDEEEDEFGNSITYQECIEPGLSFPNARAAADWMFEQERRQAEEKRARVKAEANARADAEARAKELKVKAKAKETAREKQKRAARKWLSSLGNSDDQSQGQDSGRKSPAAESSTSHDRSASSGETSHSTPEAGEASSSEPTQSLPDGWTFDGMSYKSPISIKPDGGFSYSFSSFPPSAAANDDYTIPEGEDPDPESCPMCAVMGLSNGRGRCLHTGWRKDESGNWSGPPETDEEEPFVQVRTL
ncbi:unnamed protein product [Peniophora sp. CBMAI 1063]|nr:unnamed protein product [Peniophora sp. CBMAI 1063]